MNAKNAPIKPNPIEPIAINILKELWVSPCVKNSVNQCLGIPNISKGGLAINPLIMLKNGDRM